jgi:3-hydroxybutyryl-CoA dehydrogenase
VNVLVIGAGLMGSQIACEYALGGHTVSVASRDPSSVMERLDPVLDLCGRLGLTSEPVGDIRRRLAVAAGPPECDLVIESVPEDLALKVAVLRPVAERCEDAVIATNTSSLSISELGNEIGAPERTIGTHYWNPPLLMPLVEVIAGARTLPGVVERVRATLIELGKRPVVVARDVPGFVWNRLQLAVMREALWLVKSRVVSPADVDTVVREGLARRWRHVGPFEAAALGGVDTWRRVGENLLPALSDAQDLADLERWLPTDEAALREARRRRDDLLAAELIDERRASLAGHAPRTEGGRPCLTASSAAAPFWMGPGANRSRRTSS